MSLISCMKKAAGFLSDVDKQRILARTYQLREADGLTEEAAAQRAVQEIIDEAKSELQDRLGDITRSNSRGLKPEIVETAGKVLRYLTPTERTKLRRDTATKLVQIFDELPSANEMAAVAYAGRAKRGWYQHSAQALVHMFGPDAPRFAALLSALSPQTGVDDNLRNALNTWTRWTQEGRPTDREAIYQIMGKSVQGNGTTDSVLDAWVNNSVRALSSADPENLVISGPKVNSFMLNLRGVVHEVTNDAWMANYAAVDQTIFSGSLNAAGTEPGKGPGYLAMSARVRQAAATLTRLTGDTWTPAEVQETVWSWAKTLYELQAVGKTARQILDNGELTHELIAATPDFRTLFHEERNEEPLRRAGYAEQLDSLRGGNAAGAAGAQGPGAGGQAAPFDRDAQARHERRAGGRLEQLKADRDAAKALSRAGAIDPRSSQADAPEEEVLRSAPRGGRDAHGNLGGLPIEVSVPGLGKIQVGHWAQAEQVARDYAAAAGVEYAPPNTYVKVDPERAKRIADAYEAMAHAPQDPQVRAAYDALAAETLAQYEAVLQSGLKVEFIDFGKTGDPYAASPRLATEDVRKNNHMWVFSTREGFGSSAFDPKENPLLAETEHEISGQKALVNDLFRVVHDYFGHVKEGVGFRADGEENAWRAHSAMFSPLARKALTTETRGQNSWVNFGEHGDFNRTASGADTIYADQKTGLLPDWVVSEGAGDDVARSPRRADAALEDAGLEIAHKPDWHVDGDVLHAPLQVKTRDGDKHVTAWFSEIPETEGRYVLAFEDEKGHDVEPNALRSPGRTVQVDSQRLPIENSAGQPLVAQHDFAKLKNFWSWFGGSKVVDERGRPMVVFHGSRDGSISAFKPVTYFSEAADEAQMYTKSGALYPVYVSIEKPYVASDEQDAENRSELTELDEEYADDLRARGFDGVIARRNGVTLWAIPFLPEQIKSAIGNDGSFDAKSADITRSSDRDATFRRNAELGYNPDLPRGTYGPETAQERELRTQMLDLDQQAGQAWGQARNALIVQERAKLKMPEGITPEMLDQIAKTLVQHHLVDRVIDADTHPLFADYRAAVTERQRLQKALGDEIVQHIGAPEFQGMRQLAEFPRPQTETPEFKQWFEGSKVVGKDGRPLIAFHGTNQDIKAFNPLIKGGQLSKNNWNGHLGTWFAAPAASNEYEVGNAETTADVFAELRGRDDEITPGAVVYPVFLSIKNPAEFEGYEDLTDQRDELSAEDFRQHLIDEGHDGLVVRDSDTDGGQNRDDWVAFHPEQIKSALGNNGEFAIDQGAIARSPQRPAWKSQLELAVESVPDRLQTMAAPQWKLWLEANASKLGVKKDEISWSGIDDYLKLRGKDKVTRDELAQFVRDNGVKVQEVVLGGASSKGNTAEIDDIIVKLDARGFTVDRDELGYEKVNLTRRSDATEFEYEADTNRLVQVDGTKTIRAPGVLELASRLHELTDGSADGDLADGTGTKYAKYTVPGGENYREVLITLPTGMTEAQKQRKHDLDKLYYARKEMTDDERAERDRLQSKIGAPEYRSSHWDESNILAHLRVDDRTDAEGKKVLFLNEVQSDWAQEGRKNGFVGDAPSPLTPEQERAVRTHYEMLERQRPQLIHGAETVDQMIEQMGMREANAAMTDEGLSQIDERHNDHVRRGMIPRAPFVRDTKAWVSLALKRAITMAVEGGYDKVALISGEQAADLYDLSKQVSSIVYAKDKDQDLWEVEVRDHSDSEVLQEDAAPASRLEELIGKEVAQKIVSGEGERITPDGPRDWRRLSGLDLKVGGEGMRSFYDKIVPQVANDVLKKLGGRKVETVDLTRNSGLTIEEDDRGFVVYDGNEDMLARFASERTAREYIAGEQAGAGKQPGFSITPQMRENLEGGAPLFSPSRGAPETPAFRSWFGDSKVVNEDGSPMVVYHGTDHPDISKFAGLETVGWFTESTDQASSYADEGRSQAGHPNVIPVFLSIKNPLVLDFSMNSRPKDGAIEAAAKIGMDDRMITVHKLKGTPFDWAERAWEIVNDSDFFRAARKSGYDGVKVMEGGNWTWAPISGTQIKSIFNDGSFDPDSKDISRSTARAQLGALNVGLGYQVADFLDSSKKVSWWDKTVGTPYHLAQKHPKTFGRVYNAIQDFIAGVSHFANRAMDLAPNILPKLENFSDIWKSPLSAEDATALKGPIFQGTLSYMRDGNGDAVQTSDVGLAGLVWRDDELRDMWHLNAEQIKLYREFRRATNKSLSDMAITQMIRVAGESADGVRGLVLNSPNVKVAAERLADHLAWLAANDPKRAHTLMSLAEGVKDVADTAQGLIAKGYAPLTRYGDYTVYVTQMVNGAQEQVYFGMFESEAEANKMAREFRADPQYQGAQVTQGTMSKQAHELFKGITPETLALFGESLGLSESSNDQHSQVFQEYLKLSRSSRSAMKRMIERKGVAGFSEDVARVLASFLYSNARQASTNLHAGNITRYANDIPQEAGDLKDMAIRLATYAQSPQNEAQTLRGMLFANYIGGSIASALVNTTQSFTTTWPTLSQYFGIGKSGRAMAQSLDIIKNGAGADADLKLALDRAADEGITDPNETHQLQAIAQGRAQLRTGDGTTAGNALATARNRLSKLQLIWGKGFGLAESLNRQVAFISAYRLARDAGRADAYEFARGIVSDTQFVMNKGANPVWARGAVGATLFTFKKFGVFYLENLARMWGNGAEGKKAFAFSLAIMFLLAGAGGFPFEEDLENLVDAFAQRVLGRSFNSRLEMKQYFAGLLGDAGADFVLSGLSGLPGAPIDVSGRLGLGHLIPGSGVLTKKSDYSRDIAEVVGPAGDMVKRALAAAAGIAAGEPLQAAKAVAPTAVQNAVQMADMLATGSYRDAKGRKVMDTTPTEAVLKGIGFQPASVKGVQEAAGIAQNLVDQNRVRHQEILDLWTRGRVDRNPDLVEQAKQQLAEWNRDNPDSPLKIDPSAVNKRVQQAMMEKSKRLAAAAPKAIRQSVREIVAPATPD